MTILLAAISEEALIGRGTKVYKIIPFFLFLLFFISSIDVLGAPPTYRGQTVWDEQFMRETFLLEQKKIAERDLRIRNEYRLREYNARLARQREVLYQKQLQIERQKSTAYLSFNDLGISVRSVGIIASLDKFTYLFEVENISRTAVNAKLDICLLSGRMQTAAEKLWMLEDFQPGGTMLIQMNSPVMPMSLLKTESSINRFSCEMVIGKHVYGRSLASISNCVK